MPATEAGKFHDLNRQARRALASEARRTAYLTPPQIAARLRVKPHKVLAWINSGRLRALNISAGAERPRYRVHEADLQVFLDSLAVNKPPVQTRRRRQQNTEVIQFFS